ncbi:MAG: (cytosine-5)-methyltransferase 1 [Candidatus Eremiobacteraeota bacterium]|jgi:DNA (cytosine-5)-methyltransferase 1|nr:(cytosine-5)-methyltransferase 1 [Candidatus Eremiobacteraeota bacterium]
MRIGSLFSGIGGFERALGEIDEPVLMCEVDPACRQILNRHFKGVAIHDDVRTLASLPRVDALVAGFPCQDLSPAGRTRGIDGPHSSLLREVLRLIMKAKSRPPWVILENVPFIRHLAGGEALSEITAAFEQLRYRWAYRIVDAQSFGLPQRRKRWLFVASLAGDPREVLFADDAQTTPDSDPKAYGFYWTEGNRGLGLAADAIPPLKVGSGFGIPASPAIWDRDARRIVTPAIEDAERLQGFVADWTHGVTQRDRWRMVGNAVSVPAARWLVRRMHRPGVYDRSLDFRLSGSWPAAAWGDSKRQFGVNISDRPATKAMTPILDFLRWEPHALSTRAAAGFLSRARASKLRMPNGFLADIAHHINRADDT